MEYIEIAAKMLDCKVEDMEKDCIGLVRLLNDMNKFCESVEGKLKSRQVIALIIYSYYQDDKILKASFGF